MKLADKVMQTVKDSITWIIDSVIELFEKPIVLFFKARTAKGTIETKVMQTPEMQKKVEELKKKWGESPENISDIVTDVLDFVVGRSAKVQLESVMGKEISQDEKTIVRMFDQMAALTDVTVFSQFLALIGAVIPEANIWRLGPEIRAYLDYSGMSQITGYGYGMLLSTALGPPIQQEVRSLMQRDILDQGTLRLLNMREIIPDKDYETELKKWGLDEDRRDHWTKAGLYYPPGPDFVRFAVREVFREDVVKANQYDKDFPEDIVPHALKAGMSRDILQWYWRAHWELPSPRMGYEMMHRGFIDKARLKTLLQTDDYAPGWIDEMIAISHTPFTRVDARRLYKDGVLNEEQFIKANMDIGYTKEMAEQILDWLQSDISEPDRDLTRSQIMGAYKLDLMTLNDTQVMLRDLGYDSYEAALIIGLEDEKERLQDIRDALEVLRYEYSKGLWTVEAFNEQIKGLGLSIAQGKKELVKAKRMRSKAISLPSKEDVLKWYKVGNINEDEASTKLYALGYLVPDVKLYLGVK